jgi:hypothetical protein
MELLLAMKDFVSLGSEEATLSMTSVRGHAVNELVPWVIK